MKELKTSKDWFKLIPQEHNFLIMDPDGWDRENYDYSFNKEKISKQEFKKRVRYSTVICKNTFDFESW